MQDTLAMAVKHSQWAADRLFAVASTLTDDQYCRRLGGQLGSVQVLVAQIGHEAQAWRTRLEGGLPTATLAEEQQPTLDEVKRELTHAYDLLAREAARSVEDLEEELAYRDSNGHDPRGRYARVPRWALLRHFVDRAAYHHGQLASMLRLLDRTPPAVDLLAWFLDQQTDQPVA